MNKVIKKSKYRDKNKRKSINNKPKKSKSKQSKSKQSKKDKNRKQNKQNKQNRSISKNETIFAKNKKNQIFIDEFMKMKSQVRYDMDHTKDKQIKLQNSFKIQVIDNVIKIISKMDVHITNPKQLEDIKGIGKKTLQRIDEIIKTGKLSELDQLPDIAEYQKYIDELSEIYGIGDKLAYELFKKYDVKNIDDLKKLYHSGKIDLPDVVVKGLKYHGIVKDKIPFSEMQQIDNYLHKILYKIDKELFGIICGSYRRLAPFSGDIDMLIVHPKIKTFDDKSYTKNINYLELFITELKKDKFIVDSLTADDVITTYRGYCKYNNNPVRRIDLRFIPYESYYSAILYFTGPKDFNKKMRTLAIAQGYSLSEYGLTDENGNIVHANSEKEIFDILGMEYLPPEKRK